MVSHDIVSTCVKDKRKLTASLEKKKKWTPHEKIHVVGTTKRYLNDDHNDNIDDLDCLPPLTRPFKGDIEEALDKLQDISLFHLTDIFQVVN